MNRERFDELLAGALGGELSDADRAAFDAHLAADAQARAEYDSLQAAVSQMQSLDAPARVNVSRHGDRLVLDRAAASRRPATFSFGRLGIAASVLLAFLAGYLLHVGLMFRDRPSTPSSINPTAVAVAENKSPDLRTALASVHAEHPEYSDFCKLVVAMSR